MATTFTFDKGPSASWAKRFFQAPRAYYAAHPSQRFRTEFGPVYYRGRLSGTARMLIVGQDPSTDEILAQRNLVGLSGQRVQRLLNKLGVVKSYLMLNTFLFGRRHPQPTRRRHHHQVDVTVKRHGIVADLFHPPSADKGCPIFD